jgi:hypothetical protein
MGAFYTAILPFLPLVERVVMPSTANVKGNIASAKLVVASQKIYL